MIENSLSTTYMKSTNNTQTKKRRMKNNAKWRRIGDTEETYKIKMKNNAKFERIGNTEETYSITNSH